MTKTVKDEIIDQVDRLAAPQQRKVLDYARLLTAPAGTPGGELMHFVGSIDAADLEAMAHAIQEGCEKIGPHGW